MLRLIIAAVVLLASAQANAYMLVKDYEEHFKGTDEAGLYILGVGVGIVWTNSFLTAQRGGLLFCPQDNSAMTQELFLDILHREIAFFREEGEDVNDAAIELFLLSGFIRTFPCEE